MKKIEQSQNGKKKRRKRRKKEKNNNNKKCTSNPNRQGRGRKKKTWKLTENPK